MRLVFLLALLGLVACGPVSKSDLYTGDDGEGDDAISLAAAHSFETWCHRSDITPAQKSTIETVMKVMKTNDCVQAGQLLSEEEELDLSAQPILDVTPLLGFKQLTGLYLYQTGIDQAQAEKLSALENLTDLDLSNNHLTAIPQLPPGLINLDLSGNQIVNWNTDLSKFNALTDLSLRENNLSALEALPKNLQVLDIGVNPVEQNNTIVAALHSLSRIKEIYLTNKNLVVSLKSELPQAKIVTDKPLVIFP